MQIGSRLIGPAHAPYIIAELGVNHDGSVERALELTRAAAAAGADAVKLQLFETDRLMSKASKLAAYQKAAGETDPVAMLRRLELGIDDMARVVDLAHELGVHAIVTVFSVELVAVAERLAWDAYKTASPDIVHKPLLEALAATGKPLIVSTGASTMEEVERAVGWLTSAGARDRLALMQCVSCYPTPDDKAELGGIRAIAEHTSVATGYSDHTRAHATSMHAVFAGACILEKHLTYNRRAMGPDHAASLTPDMLRQYVELAAKGVEFRSMPAGSTDEGLRKMHWQLERQQSVKRVLDIEQDVRAVSRQSITTRRVLPAGHTLTREDLTFKRPGSGLLPFQLGSILGRTLARDVETDVPLMAEDVQW